MERPSVSIVIPVLDDTEALARLLPAIEPHAEVEILVVSGGGPEPQLTAVATRPDVRMVSSAPGRGHQMNVGARAAEGRWLLFLHADTRLPRQWLEEVRRADADSRIVGGSFRFQLASDAWQARVLERGVRWRVRWLGLAYGDQALFVRRDAFEAVGGYREWPLMEDVELIRGLRRLGRLYHSHLPIATSARRWERDGWWRRSAGNILFQVLFFAGVSPDWLARRYSGRAAGARWAPREALVIMARAPSDTRGKSRLTRGLRGDPVGLRRALLLDTLDAVRGVSRADLFVAFAPAEARQEMEALVGCSARLFPQHGETLGQQMQDAFERVFAQGYASVAIVGSDVPTLPLDHVQQAFSRLRARKSAVVIGPATDGGYYLIGLQSGPGAPAPELFETMPWSTPEVLAATVAAADKLGLSVSLLPEWYDVDDLGGLRRVMREETGAARTHEWIRAQTEINRLLGQGEVSASSLARPMKSHAV